MFDLPGAKRVRRDEVLSPASSRSSSPAPNESDIQDAHARLGKLLDLDRILTTESTRDLNNEPAQPNKNTEDDEQEFEFRLFSAPAPSKPDADSANITKAPVGKSKSEKKEKKLESLETEATNAGTQKLRIRLRSPTPVSTDPSEGRFVKAFRGWRYYFTSPSLSGLRTTDTVLENEDNDAAEKRRKCEDAAVTGEHMLTWAQAQPWPGCDLPWRVIRLKRHQTKLPPASRDVTVYRIEDAPVSKSPKSRKKPGKKRRIQLRMRATAAEVARETEAEKRNRKNREKKIKRRQKAREEKEAAAAAAVVGEGQTDDVPMADASDDLSQESD